MKYRAEIDGLRAVAVVPVILFHAGFEFFSGGFIGVDVFFVISGYLITTILIEDIERNRFSIINFYERRARRILPALTVVILITSVMGWILLNPTELKNFGGALLGVATFTSNVVFWRQQGYFDESAELNPLLHTWSLAVEEQYYVIFPIFLLFAWRFGRSRVFWTITILAVVSLFLSEWGWRNKAAANFYLSPTRAWELLAGSLSAFIIQKQGVKSNSGLSILGLVAILSSIYFYDETTPFPSVYALLPVCGTVFLILFAEGKTFVARLLSIKWIVKIGLVSYSAYLIHQPLFAFFRKVNGELNIPLYSGLALVTLCFLLAYISWKYVELPFRNRKKVSSKQIGLFSLCSISIIACAGLLSKSITGNIEQKMAFELVNADYIYFTNIDERKFNAFRLSLPLKPINTLVMGSSRIMQVGSNSLGDEVLNLGVSGASIEDDIGFIGEAVAKLNPSRVFIGADPWILNKDNGQDRWQSIDELYEFWLEPISKAVVLNSELQRFLEDTGKVQDKSWLTNLYRKVNISGTVVASDGSHEAVGKKAYDGYHIYNEEYISKTQSSMEDDFTGLLNYAMATFEYDSNSENQLRQLIQWLKANNIEVFLVLSPYHPGLYERMRLEKGIFLSIEDSYRKIAMEMGVGIVGSYNPRLAGCTETEFYDGMHPKEKCMQKVLDPITNKLDSIH